MYFSDRVLRGLKSLYSKYPIPFYDSNKNCEPQRGKLLEIKKLRNVVFTLNYLVLEIILGVCKFQKIFPQRVLFNCSKMYDSAAVGCRF